jgi:hypothetical protein
MRRGEGRGDYHGKNDVGCLSPVHPMPFLVSTEEYAGYTGITPWRLRGLVTCLDA